MSRSMNKKKFLTEYKYEVEKNFDVDGIPASWAAPTNGKPAHRFWDDEDDKIELHFFDKQNLGDIINLTPSHDGRLIAGSNGSSVGVFNLETQEQCMQFKGLAVPCVGLIFSPSLNESGGYTLVIESADREEDEQSMFFLDLDRDGRRTNEANLIDVDGLLQKSLDPVVSELDRSFDIASTSPLVGSVRESYGKALEILRARLESRDLSRVTGSTGNFGSSPLSADNGLFLYIIQNESTQNENFRPEAELPKVVVYDMINKCQKYVLSGHEDAIMWTAFSPDSRYIATAAWDGTFRIFSVLTGDCNHVIGPTGGQCWSGAWSPDSKHLLVSGMTDEGEGEGSRNDPFIAVYSVETAQQVNRFTSEKRIRDWVRCVAWSPRGEIAIVSESNQLWIWEPFENKTVSSFKLKVEDWLMEHFASVSGVQWVNGGEILIVSTGHGTIEIWDRMENTKWRLQRPEGSGTERNIGIVRWVKEDRTLRTFSRDSFMRSYKL
ncbi:WD40 repeat-like protein [Aureobasidium sp. EXF-8845]|nr:WD40 repeat-like protein [Aureobasidium sp. EXF-8845]KAI4857198.1 WD40 repeat-like protein [Aureobasidium sp. EXF-8846]